MTVTVNGGPAQTGRYVAVHHATADGLNWPAVFSIYSSGYLRLSPIVGGKTQFGTSVVLGPAYWSGGTYYHNPAINAVSITGDFRVAETLTVTAVGRLGNADVEYVILLHRPEGEATSCQVTQRATWRNDTKIDAKHSAKHEGFKVVQFSSMFVDDTYHDADSVRYVSAAGPVAMPLVNQDGVLFAEPAPLHEPWLETTHSDAEGWQGATPSVSATLHTSTIPAQYTPQGWVTQTDNENDDNVGAWINWDNVPAKFFAGNQASNTYTLTASASPRQ